VFSKPQLDGKENNWRYQLNKFVKANQRELAALSWGFWLAKGGCQDTLAIDLKPTPHFISCPKAELEKLNQNLDNHIQEILGVVDGYDANKEVVIIAIGNSQIKLIQFLSEPSPPTCYQEIAADVDTLVQLLEQRMIEEIKD
jgi:hypothetical protein